MDISLINNNTKKITNNISINKSKINNSSNNNNSERENNHTEIIITLYLFTALLYSALDDFLHALVHQPRTFNLYQSQPTSYTASVGPFLYYPPRKYDHYVWPTKKQADCSGATAC